MNLVEYRRRPSLLADFLPWAGLVAPGVVLNKDGSFQRTARFRGPDLDSATEAELVAVTARVNNALRRLGSGWALFVEAASHPAASYPVSAFPDPLSWLVDEERRAAFEAVDSHFECSYFLTLLRQGPPDAEARIRGWFYEGSDQRATDWREQLDGFVHACDQILTLLEGVMPEMAWLDDKSTLTYLHSTVSTARQPLQVPEVPFHLDALLADAPLAGGVEPRLGEVHLRVLTIRGFPTSTWPGVLEELNRLGLGYRWMTRFMCLDKGDAERELAKRRRQWFAKRKGVVALLRETVFQQESPFVDSDAANKAEDADVALQELGSDAVAYGYVTATVVVAERGPERVDAALKAIERVIQGRGFVTVRETLNAVEAWLSSIPGHVYANVRQPLVSTLNLAHLLPLSAVWAGPERNAHLDAPPMIVTRTAGATPFRLVTHVDDVGHTLIVGPTGAGKSVLLAIMAMQFRRYRNARVFAFDKGRSLRATILGLGGEHYDLGAGGSMAFQPLAHIDRPSNRAWTAEWIGMIVRREGVPMTPEVKDALWSALASLASAMPAERTLTGFLALLQSDGLRQAIEPFTVSGPFGRLLDADRDRLGSGDVQCFEMEEMMPLRGALLPLLTWLFHRIEARFDGAPTLLVLDEAWVFLDDADFAARLREWLKTLRKKNVSVVFATQSLADIQASTIAPAIVESCATRIFLPSPQANEPQLRSVYESFGLNGREIGMLAEAEPRRDYYLQSRLGRRWFDLGLGPVALAFAAASGPEHQRAIDTVIATTGRKGFAEAWLRHRKLVWAAELAADLRERMGEGR